MTKPVWSHVLALSAWTLKKAYNQLPGSLGPDYKYLHGRQIPYQVKLPSQTIPDCISYVIGVFWCFSNLHFSYIVQNRSGEVMFTWSIYEH